HSVYNCRAPELVRFLLNPNLRCCFDERINCRRGEFTERGTASSRVRGRRICADQVDFLLQMNLDHFAVLCRARKMAGAAAAVKENMKHDLIECRILGMSVTFPIGDMHVPLDIPFVRSIPLNSNGSMHKIGAGLPIPQSELNDFDKSSAGRSKSGSERSGVPSACHCIQFHKMFKESDLRFKRCVEM